MSMFSILVPLIMQVATTVQVTQSSGTMVTMSFARDAA